MLTGESRCAVCDSLTNFSLLNSDLEQEIESKTNQEELVLIWNEATPKGLKAQDVTKPNLRTPPADVPCVRLMAPVAGAIAVHELQGNAKRPRISPAALFPEPEVVSKPATSLPAMIIPHLVSHRTAIPPKSMVFHG
jgi:hypothetical protein